MAALYKDIVREGQVILSLGGGHRYDDSFHKNTILIFFRVRLTRSPYLLQCWKFVFIFPPGKFGFVPPCS